MRRSFAVVLFATPLLAAACSSDSDGSGAGGSGGNDASASGGSAGSAGAATGGSGGVGGSGGSAGAATGGTAGAATGGTAGVASGGTAGAATGGVGGVAGAGAGGSAGLAGGGGSGGQVAVPTCDQQPTGSTQKTIKQLWSDNPSTPVAAWIPGVYVTAISGNGCSSGTSCQLFVQQQETFTSFAAGAQQAMRVAVAPNAAQYFSGVSVGDRVDLYGSVWRHTQNGENELYLLATDQLPGCIKSVGSGTLAPITGVDLVDLTLTAYEQTHGPLLIRVDTVSGKPHLPNETFALFESFMPGDAGITEVVSLSPYCLTGGVFTTLSQDVLTNFSSVTGVFGLFVPVAGGIKYKEIYVRSAADYPIAAP